MADKINIAELSDEEVMNLDPASLDEATQAMDAAGASGDGSPSPPDDSAAAPAAADLSQEGVDPDDDAKNALGDPDELDPSGELDELDKIAIQTLEEGKDHKTAFEDGDKAQQVSRETGKSAGKPGAATPVNYEGEYNRLLAPFKGAQREIKVNNVDDARQLMQMGVDYARKMEALKPYQRILKTLERHKLVDEASINMLIDLHAGKPEAVSKFLKEKSIDPMDLSDEDGDAYKPNNNLISDRELALEDVLDDIRETDSFQRTVTEIADKWDTASKQILMENPALIRVINGHIALGVYDQIMNLVAQERTFGRLRGVSDLEAYKAVGDAIDAQGGFAPYQQHVGQRSANAGAPANIPANMPASRGSTGSRQQPSTSDQARSTGSGFSASAGNNNGTAVKDRKRAASPTRATMTRKEPAKVNFLSLSDEEFERVDAAIQVGNLRG